jgi:DNA-directed RNA polymerase subunit RPC12/RpoP
MSRAEDLARDRARAAAGAQAIRDEEEGKAKKIFKSAWDWLTTDDNDELLGKLDTTLGTKLQEGRRQAGAMAREAVRVEAEDLVSRDAAPSSSPHDCIHRPPCVGPRCTVYSASEHVTVEGEGEGPIVLVKKRALCTTCRGHGALEFDEETKRTRPIPCPACGVRPRQAAARADKQEKRER